MIGMVESESSFPPVTVVIPTYRRPVSLIECIRSMVDGSQQPNEIIVVGRDDDGPTKEALFRVHELCAGKMLTHTGWVTEPGHIPPVKKGLELASGEIVCFVDDDV